jgi:hypothetical protein
VLSNIILIAGPEHADRAKQAGCPDSRQQRIYAKSAAVAARITTIDLMGEKWRREENARLIAGVFGS